MATLQLRTDQATPLTNSQMDGNLEALNNELIDGISYSSGTISLSRVGGTTNFPDLTASIGSATIAWSDITGGKRITLTDHAGNTDTVDLKAGTGLSVARSGQVVTFTNSDLGSSQYIFKNITAEQPDGTDIGTISTSVNNDTLYVRETQVDSTDGIVLAVDATNQILKIGHANTSSQADVSNTGNNFIQSMTFDTYGHVASVTSGTVNQTNFYLEDGDGTEVNITDGKEVKFVEGTGDGASIDINWTDTSTGSNADPFDLTFSVTNDDKGSSQYIFKNITAEQPDGTDIGTITVDNNNDTLYIRETQVDTTDGIVLAVDATNQILKIGHANTSSQGSVNNSNGTVIQDITLDTYGHITGINSLNGDNRWVNDTGDTMTGNLNFSDNAEGITWSRNTDGASIKFYNTGDSDTNSRLEFNTLDNGNEFFRWTTTSGANTYELASLKLNGTTGKLDIARITNTQGAELRISNEYAGTNGISTATYIIGNQPPSSATSGTGTGGILQLQAGAGSDSPSVTDADGGNLNLMAGAGGSYNGDGGNVYIASGNPSSGGYQSTITLNGGARAGRGGDIAIIAGNSSGTSDGANVAITAGNGNTVNGNGGAVIIEGGRSPIPTDGLGGYAANITIGGGQANGTGGELLLSGGDSTGYVGASEQGGSVTIATGRGWAYDFNKIDFQIARGNYANVQQKLFNILNLSVEGLKIGGNSSDYVPSNVTANDWGNKIRFWDYDLGWRGISYSSTDHCLKTSWDGDKILDEGDINKTFTIYNVNGEELFSMRGFS